MLGQERKRNLEQPLAALQQPQLGHGYISKERGNASTDASMSFYIGEICSDTVIMTIADTPGKSQGRPGLMLFMRNCIQATGRASMIGSIQ